MVNSNYNTSHNIISNSIEDFDTYKNNYLYVNLPAPREKDHKHFFAEDYDEELDIVLYNEPQTNNFSEDYDEKLDIICNDEEDNNIDANLEYQPKDHHIITIDDSFDDLDDVYYNGINCSDSYKPLSAPRGNDNVKFFNNNNKFNIFNILRKCCCSSFC